MIAIMFLVWVILLEFLAMIFMPIWVPLFILYKYLTGKHISKGATP